MAQPDLRSYTIALKACAKVGDVSSGRKIFQEVGQKLKVWMDGCGWMDEWMYTHSGLASLLIHHVTHTYTYTHTVLTVECLIPPRRVADSVLDVCECHSWSQIMSCTPHSRSSMPKGNCVTR